MRIVTPDLGSDIVTSFCSRIVPREMPFYVLIEPMPHAEGKECFENVQKKISTEGGDIVYGWSIWLCPDFFIEAEFHAIWRSPEGIHIDTTPQDDGTQQILFVSDKTRKYEGYQVDNIRYNISRNQLVDNFISIFECNFLIKNHGERAFARIIHLTKEENEILIHLASHCDLIEQMLTNGYSRNTLCPCGSGTKYKKCCEKQLIKTINFIKNEYTRHDFNAEIR